MHPLWLRFPDPQREREYDRYIQSQLWSSDTGYLTLGVLVFTLFIGRTYCAAGAPPATASPLLVCYVMCWVAYVWMLGTRLKMGQDAFAAWRPILVSVFRIWIVLNCVLAGPYINFPLQSLDYGLATIVHAFFASNGFNALVGAMGLCLKFPHHLITQSISMVMLLYGKGRGYCDCASHSINGKYIYAMEDTLGDMSHRIFIALYSVFVDRGTAMPIKEPCVHFATFVHLFFGVGIVSYVIWDLERRSRLRYIQTVNDWHGDTPLLISWTTRMQHLLVLVISFGLGWEALGFVSSVISKSGRPSALCAMLTESSEICEAHEYFWHELLDMCPV